MKKMRRILGILLAAVMMLCMSVAAVPAADDTPTTYTITIKDAVSGHTYEAYQIFEGRLEKNTLSDIKWGSGVNGDEILNNLEDTEFSGKTTAAEIAESLSSNNKGNAGEFAKLVSKHLSDTPTATASKYDADNKKYTISVLEPGYYLVKDKDNSIADTAYDAYTDFILQVVGDIDIVPKASVPSVTKKVKQSSSTVWQDSADYNIGDDVSFTLTGTLPNTLGTYKKYKYVFHDTLSPGLTLKTSTVKVTLSTDNNTTDVTKSFSISEVKKDTSGNNNFTVSCEDILKIQGVTIDRNSKIIVTYDATLNEQAVTGETGNLNTVYLEYSNNPNSNSTGNTASDTVVVFTYELDVIKQDGAEETGLKGAEFKLFKVKHDTNNNPENWWVKVDQNNRVKEWTTVEKDASTFKSDDNGKFQIVGLDDGTYHLKETKAPAEYNLPKEPFEITIESELISEWSGNGSALKKLQIQVDNNSAKDGDKATGIVSATIQNNKGATLPSTGGMGTKIFYTLGIAAFLYAAVKLTVKRRMRTMR